jgi:hypothetical protein
MNSKGYMNFNKKAQETSLSLHVGAGLVLWFSRFYRFLLLGSKTFYFRRQTAEVQCRGEVAIAPGMVGHVSAIEPLISALHDRDSSVSERAFEALHDT